MILTVRTDKPEAELGLFEDRNEKAYIRWQAGRDLSVDLHKKLDELFISGETDFEGLSGVVFYKGPGSFTGLRIGASVAGTIAYDSDIPIASTNGDNWIGEGIKLLKTEPGRRIVELEYGAPPRTTQPKK